VTAARPDLGRWLVIGAAFAIAAAGGYVAYRATASVANDTDSAQRSPPSFVGRLVCAGCHAPQDAGWRGSDHDLAMQEPQEGTVLGDFSGATFTHGGVTTSFLRRDGRYVVLTDGPDGRLAEFPVAYTFGVDPLQQYLVPMPGGRLQALGVAWDARPAARGGQRWFHLYPDRKLSPGDPLHWTGIDQSWNYQCADCHSTNLRKGYDRARDVYDTTWSEIDVACEACHGPGSHHVAWATKTGDWRRHDGTPGVGLVMPLNERRGVTWSTDPVTGAGVRSSPRTTQREIDACARCHARRSQIADEDVHLRPFADSFVLSLVEEPLYWNDGQQRDEVYTHASFLQSKMFVKGVTCSDCHEPHGLELRAPGNRLCAQCHAPEKFDVPAHHFHQAGSPGAACTACHMPTSSDHSLRVPRPDLTVAIGTPNACDRCHADEGAAWAADAVTRWYGRPAKGFQRFAPAFQAAASGAIGAERLLQDVVADPETPPIVRASALLRLGAGGGRRTLGLQEQALRDADPFVRAAAARAVRDLPPEIRSRLLRSALTDPARSVRIEAAHAVAGPAERHLANDVRGAFEAALAEYVAAQEFQADRPEGRANLGTLFAERGDLGAAERELRSAVALDPTYGPAAVNLADVLRVAGREGDAEAVLRAALVRAPGDAALHHALGLSLVRTGRMPEAIAMLRRATELDPGATRYARVLAVGLHDTGQIDAAVALLERAHERRPGDAVVVETLATFERDRGNRERARHWAATLVRIAPDEPGPRAFLESLR
jgi:predicted CXXCH cytochrome family protein